MIHGIFGKLGAGKGLHVMKIIVDELLNGHRDVVTNVPLRFVPWVNGQGKPQIGLLAYICEKLGCDLEEAETFQKRVRVMDDVDSLWDLFMWRRDGDTGDWFKMATTHADEKGRPDRFDPNEAKSRHCRPCLIVSDEAWICYPNNGGHSRSPLLPFYSRQSRKLQDEWYIVTQHPTDIDSAVWNITQDFTVCRNHGMERMGLFRQPDMFRTITYLTNPAKGGAIRSHESWSKLDAKGLAQCYDTTAGVGFTGGFKGDAGQKRKGLSPWWAAAGLLVGVVVLAFVPKILGRGASAWIGHTVARPASPASWAGMTNESPAHSTMATNQAVAALPAVVPVVQGEEIFLRGYVVLGGQATAYFSDGSSADSAGGLQTVGKDFCVVDGRKYRLRHLEPLALPVASQTSSPSSGGAGPQSQYLPTIH